MQCVEFGWGQELVGIGGEMCIDYVLCLIEWNVSVFDCVQIGDVVSEYEGKFLYFGVVGVMDYVFICGSEWFFEVEVGKVFDGVGNGGGDFILCVGVVILYCIGCKWIEIEVDIVGGGIEVVCFYIFCDMDCGYL